VPYRGAMGGRLGAAMGLGLLLVGLGIAHAAPPPPPRLPRGPSLRVDAVGPQLRPQDDGTLRHLDPDARFVGVIHPDGRVELRDLPDVDPEFTTGVRTVDWMLGLAHAITRQGSHDRPELETPTPANDPTARRDAATEIIPHGPYGPPPIMVTAGGRFGGIADLAIRRGQRKHTQAKRAFLERTAALREGLTRTHGKEQQRAAQLRLGQELATLWRDRARPLAERKRELFERWDECEEALPDELGRAADTVSQADAERGRGGEAMRRRIEAFVRQVAPVGSAAAFGADELSRLNARRLSRQRFEPYAPPTNEARDDPAASGIVAR
jgi:hypothetical protein